MVLNVLLDTGVEVLAEFGFPGVSFSSVSKAANLSRKPIHDRFENMDSYITALWEKRVLPNLTKNLESIVQSLSQDPSGLSTELTIDALIQLQSPTAINKASAQFLFRALADDEVGLSIRNELNNLLKLDSNLTQASEELKSQYAYLYVLIFTCILQSYPSIDSGAPTAKTLELKIKAALEPKPWRDILHIESRIRDAKQLQLDADEYNSLILNATLHLMADNGFYATTTKDIANEAGVSEGLIFSRFTSKEEIFSKALDAYFELQLNSANQERSENEITTSAADAENHFLMAEQVSGRSFYRSLVLQHLYLSWHSDSARAARTKNYETMFPGYAEANDYFPAKYLRSMFALDIAFGAGLIYSAQFSEAFFGISYQPVTDSLYKLVPEVLV